MNFEIPLNDERELSEQELQSIAFMNQVIADFEALRSDPVAWKQYCDDFEAIDGVRPK